MKYLISLFVGLFRGWLSERSRDEAHENLGESNANLKHEKEAIKKIEAAHSVDADDITIDGLLNDKNNRDQ